MIDRSDLTAAVNAGVLSSEQGMRLEAFLANRKKGVPIECRRRGERKSSLPFQL